MTVVVVIKLEKSGEVLRHLLDTHFPGNKLYTNDINNSSHNQQASAEDWNMARKIVTEDRVRWAVSLFAPYKSPGIDGIFPALLQKGLDILIETMVKIYRACIAYGYIPVHWHTSMYLNQDERTTPWLSPFAPSV